METACTPWREKCHKICQNMEALKKLHDPQPEDPTRDQVEQSYLLKSLIVKMENKMTNKDCVKPLKRMILGDPDITFFPPDERSQYRFPAEDKHEVAAVVSSLPNSGNFGKDISALCREAAGCQTSTARTTPAPHPTETTAYPESEASTGQVNEMEPLLQEVKEAERSHAAAAGADNYAEAPSRAQLALQKLADTFTGCSRQGGGVLIRKKYKSKKRKSKDNKTNKRKYKKRKIKDYKSKKRKQKMLKLKTHKTKYKTKKRKINK